MNYQISKSGKNPPKKSNNSLDPSEIQLLENMQKIRHKIVVMSGKGGVGKSTVSANLAISFAKKNKKVGILDADIHGPSIPSLLGVKHANPKIVNQKIQPVFNSLDIRVVSIDFFLPDLGSPVIWRGPLKMRALKQFLSDVEWDELDYLIVDLPPGTGDEPLSILQLIKDLDGVIMITIPSDLSQHVVTKAINMVNELKVPIIGLIENMSGFVCPKCKTSFDILGKNGGEVLAEEYHINFLGKIPLDPLISENADLGKSILVENQESISSKAINLIIDRIIKIIE